MAEGLTEAQKTALAEHAFPPGTSGNPGGVSKRRKHFREALDAALEEPTEDGKRTHFDLAVAAFRDAVRRGESWAVKEFLAREWPAPLRVQVSGELNITADHESLADAVDRADDAREAARKLPQPAGSAGVDSEPDPGPAGGAA